MEKIKEYCQILVLHQTIDQAFSIEKNFWAITTLSPRKLYVTCLTYLYPYYSRHPFQILFTYQILVKQDQLTIEVDSRNHSIRLINFE